MATYKISYAGGFDLELYISAGTQEVGNNRTYVYYRLRLVRTGSRTSNSNYNNPYTVNVNGSQVASGTSTYALSSSSTTRNLATGNVWVNHNADGKKTVAVSGTFRDQGGFLGSGTATRTVSGNTALPTIARASEPTTNISSVAAGSSFTVYTNRAASTFTHTVEVSLGTYKQTFTAVTTSRSVTMNSASSLGQMGSVTSRNATISVKTYSGTTLVGTKSTTISVTVPTGITPTVGTLTATETVSAVSSLALATGAMVQGVSLPNLKVTGSTAGTGSSISSQTLDFDGVTTTNTDYVLSRPIVNSGTLPFKVTTRDARSRSTSKTLNVTVLPYAAPTAVVGSADRSLSNGTVSDTGTYLKVLLSGFVASLRNGTTQRNTLTLRIDSKLRGAADSTYVNHVNRAITVSTTEAWSRTETFTRSGGFVQAGSYILRITVTDKLRSSVVIHNISTGQIALHFDANLGVGIGKYREQGALDVAGDVHSTGAIRATRGIFSGDLYSSGYKHRIVSPPYVERTFGTETATATAWVNMGITTGSNAVQITLETPTWYILSYAAWLYISGGVGEQRIGIAVSGATTIAPTLISWGDTIRMYNDPGSRYALDKYVLLEAGVNTINVQGYKTSTTTVNPTRNYQRFQAIPLRSGDNMPRYEL